VSGEHNLLDFAVSAGPNAAPSYLFAVAGPHPAALACRTRRAMIAGRTFAQRIDLGPTGNKILLALRYDGPDGSTITLRNFGCNDIPVEVGVAGGQGLELVDCFGNREKVAVRGGKAMLIASDMPRYVRLTPGQSVTFSKIDFGANLAKDAKFTYSAASEGDFKLLRDGVFPIRHLDSHTGPAWRGEYDGKTFDDKPQTLEADLPAPRAIEQVILYGGYADNAHSAILDFDLEAAQGTGWATLEKVRSPCPPSDAVSTGTGKTVGWFRDTNYYVIQLKHPVTTDKLRLVVRRITRGCFPDMTVEDQAWQISDEHLDVRALEVYGPPAEE